MTNKIWCCDICKNEFDIEDQKPNKIKKIIFCDKCKNDLKIPIKINKPSLSRTDKITLFGILILCSIIMFVGIRSQFLALDLSANFDNYVDFDNDGKYIGYEIGYSMHRLEKAIQKLADDKKEIDSMIRWHRETLEIMYGVIEQDIYDKGIYQKADLIIETLKNIKLIEEYNFTDGGKNE